MLPKLSKQSEERILKALEDVSGLINDGEAPNQAIAKVASDKNVPFGHIDLIVRAYNTGRTNIQRKEHDDVFEKASEFPIADTQEIKKIMFPEKYATKAEMQKAASVSLDYSRPPSSLLPKVKPLVLTEKLASLTDKKPEPLPTDDTVKIKKAYEEAKFRKRQFETLRSEVSNLRIKISQDITNLTTYFRTSGCTPYSEVRENSQLLFGKSAEQLFDIVKAQLPAVCEKQASTKNWTAANVTTQPYSVVKRVLDNADVHRQATVKLAQAQKAVTELEGQFHRPFVKKNRSVIDTGPLSKDAALFSDLLKSELAGKLMKELPFNKPTEGLIAADTQN
jgi:hypothetical protein